jgi:hypothetical protein
MPRMASNIENSAPSFEIVEGLTVVPSCNLDYGFASDPLGQRALELLQMTYRGEVKATQQQMRFDEEMIFRDEISDEAMEAAAFVALGGLPTITIVYRTYCFTCPSNPLRNRAIAHSDRGKGD